MQGDAAAVLDILLACRRAQRFVEGVAEAAFQRNEEKRWAVVSQLLVVGEAVKRLSDEFQEEHGGIPWAQMAGMRNRLIHGYDKINWHLVWKTATQDVPPLLAELEGLVSSQEPPADDEL
jgi:uncharacterized protein with HEPN domain